MLKLAFVVGLGAAMIAGSVQAEPRASLRMARVPYGDLDLASAAGARTMLHRLTVAAKALCVNLHTPVLPGESGRADRCRKETIASAVERLHRPQLTLALAEVPAEP
jgi:UrcA family protein